jgi:hypothetical protein
MDALFVHHFCSVDAGVRLIGQPYNRDHREPVTLRLAPDSDRRWSAANGNASVTQKTADNRSIVKERSSTAR